MSLVLASVYLQKYEQLYLHAAADDQSSRSQIAGRQPPKFVAEQLETSRVLVVSTPNYIFNDITGSTGGCLINYQYL